MNSFTGRHWPRLPGRPLQSGRVEALDEDKDDRAVVVRPRGTLTRPRTRQPGQRRQRVPVQFFEIEGERIRLTPVSIRIREPGSACAETLHAARA